MFVTDADNKLAFIKSKSIRVFPCGRRRSEILDPDNNDNTVSDQYYLPFDPEARLNTEANNRKHSGLNGYKQSYLNYWRVSGNTSQISFVIAGYLFDIEVEFSTSVGSSIEAAIMAFGSVLAESLSSSAAVSTLYANIKLADIEFFSGVNGNSATAAKTTILRDQGTNETEQPASCLDRYSGSDDANILNPEHYYFYGLSFSTSDLSSDESKANEGYVSLQLLTKNANDKWVVPETSKLPKVDHGTIENSVAVDILQAKEIDVEKNLNVKGKITQNGKPVVTANLVEQLSGTWQLQFENVSVEEIKII